MHTYIGAIQSICIKIFQRLHADNSTLGNKIVLYQSECEECYWQHVVISNDSSVVPDAIQRHGTDCQLEQGRGDGQNWAAMNICFYINTSMFIGHFLY
jgi:hypothetical protein